MRESIPNNEPDAATPADKPTLRNERGHFLKGTKPGPGNPNARATAIMRDAYKKCLTPERAEKIADTIIRLAEKGNLDAAKEVADRVGGKTSDSHTVEQVEQLTEQLEELRRAIAEITSGRSAGPSGDDAGGAGASPAAPPA